MRASAQERKCYGLGFRKARLLLQRRELPVASLRLWSDLQQQGNGVAFQSLAFDVEMASTPTEVVQRYSRMAVR